MSEATTPRLYERCTPFPTGRHPSTVRRLRNPELHGDDPLFVTDLPRYRRERELCQRWAAMCKAFGARIRLGTHDPAFRARFGVCHYMRLPSAWSIWPDAALTDEQIDAELARVFARIAQGRRVEDV